MGDTNRLSVEEVERLVADWDEVAPIGDGMDFWKSCLKQLLDTMHENERLREALRRTCKRLNIENADKSPNTYWWESDDGDFIKAAFDNPSKQSLIAPCKECGAVIGHEAKCNFSRPTQNPVEIVDHTESRCGGEGDLHRFHGNTCFVCGYERRTKTPDTK